MDTTVFDRDTLLDLTVNVIPLVILGFFAVAFLAVSPFGFDPVFSGIQLAIIGTMFLGLAALTYYSGRAISTAEKAAEAQE